MKMLPKTIYRWYCNALGNPKYRWWLILGTLLYLVSPIDISPDLIPLAGQVDDFILLTLMLTEVMRLMSQAFQSETPKAVPNDEKESQPTIDVKAVSVD